MIVENVSYSVRTDTMPITSSNGMVMDRVVTGRTVKVHMDLVLDDTDMLGIGDIREVPARVEKAFRKAEIARAVVDEIRKPRAYGEET